MSLLLLLLSAALPLPLPLPLPPLLLQSLSVLISVRWYRGCYL